MFAIESCKTSSENKGNKKARKYKHRGVRHVEVDRIYVQIVECVECIEYIMCPVLFELKSLPVILIRLCR